MTHADTIVLSAGANLGALRICGDGPLGMDLESKTLWIDPAKV
jgi:hypothetical protein